MTKINLIVDGEKITAQAGQSVMQAALAAGIYILTSVRMMTWCLPVPVVFASSKLRAGKSRLPPAPHRQKRVWLSQPGPTVSDRCVVWRRSFYWLRIRPSAHPVPNI